MKRTTRRLRWSGALVLLVLVASPGCGGLLLHRLFHPCRPGPGDCCQYGCGEIYWGDHTVDVGPDPCCYDAPECESCQ